MTAAEIPAARLEMRTLFLVLFLANVTFFAYGVARERAALKNPIADLEVNRDRIRVIMPPEKPHALLLQPSPALAAAPAVPCLEWGAVAGSGVARADAAIAALGLPQGSFQRTVLDAGGYWVYLPPVKTKAELERNLAELAASGVNDYFVVQDSMAWRNAVSLGIFKSEEAAANFLQGVRAKGVKAAVVGRRENFLRQIAYLVRDPDAVTVARLAELQREFPDTEVKAVACPTEMR